MERFNFLTGGQPFRLDDFQRLYNLTKESVDKLGRILQYGSYKNVILEGCGLSKTVGSPNDTYVYSSGYTVIDGYGIVKFPAVTLTELTGAIPSHSLYLCSRNESGGSVIFKDLNTKDIWPIYEVIVKKTTGSPTGTLICTYATLYTTEQGLFSSILPSVSGAISSEASIRTSADSSLATALNSADTSLYTVLSTSISSESSLRTSADSSLTTALSTAVANDGTLKHLVVNIGDWNMDSTELKLVLIPMTTISTITKIRQIQIVILGDDYQPIIADLCTPYTGYTSQGSFILGEDSEVSTTNILVYLYRLTNGYFDNNVYDQTSYNRGYVTISYVA